MTAIQCPVCELRFSNDRDLDDHLRIDHPDKHLEPTDEESRILLEKKRKERHPPN